LASGENRVFDGIQQLGDRILPLQTAILRQRDNLMRE
jgi:hypothetical protein